MINRNSWGCLYFIVRGEILVFMKDKLMRKHSSRIFSCDKERKLEAWRWSDTVVILTVNVVGQGLEISVKRVLWSKIYSTHNFFRTFVRNHWAFGFWLAAHWIGRFDLAGASPKGSDGLGEGYRKWCCGIQQRVLFSDRPTATHDAAGWEKRADRAGRSSIRERKQ